MSETVDRLMPSTPAQAYAMKARGDQDAPEVIAGIISCVHLRNLFNFLG